MTSWEVPEVIGGNGKSWDSMRGLSSAVGQIPDPFLETFDILGEYCKCIGTKNFKS